MEISSIAGDLASAATALGGLILVFLAATVAGYQSYAATAQPSVDWKFRSRVWLAFGALLLAFVSAGISLYAKAAANGAATWVSITLLAIAAIVTLIVAILTVLEVAS